MTDCQSESVTRVKCSAEFINRNSSLLIHGTGGHGIAEVTKDRRYVRKLFDDRTSADPYLEMNREFGRMIRLHQRLKRSAGIVCPKPICVESHVPAFWMTFCEGDRLDVRLAAPTCWKLDELRNIATSMVAGVEAFVEEFNAPYDLSPANILYAEATGVVAMIDFSAPEFFGTTCSSRSPFEMTLGQFVGLCIDRSLNPRIFYSRKRVRSHMKLANNVIELLRERRAVSAEAIRTVAMDAFWFRVSQRRGLARRWFRVIGSVMLQRRLNQIPEFVSSMSRNGGEQVSKEGRKSVG